MSEKWTRGPLENFGKFILINLGKKPFVYILGPLSHRHPMGCLLKSGPLDHRLEIFLKEKACLKSGPEDHRIFLENLY